MSINKQRENSGILFKNDRKETESHPDYVGTLNVAGAEFFINGWIKQGAKAKFMSLSVRPKDAAKAAAVFHSEEAPF
jgi:hypothetical protein